MTPGDSVSHVEGEDKGGKVGGGGGGCDNGDENKGNGPMGKK